MASVWQSLPCTELSFGNGLLNFYAEVKTMALSAEEAASYENTSRPQEEMGMKLINMTSLKKGNTVLDLGCGTGYLTKVLSDKVGPEGKVVAVDPDGERLKIAREKYILC